MTKKRSLDDCLSRPPTTTGPRVLWGSKEIGEYLRIHPVTMRKWVKTKGLPAALGPKATYFTTTSLIDHWIVTLRSVQAERKKKLMK
jgi:hypothetical protein